MDKFSYLNLREIAQMELQEAGKRSCTDVILFCYETESYIKIAHLTLSNCMLNARLGFNTPAQIA